MALNRALKAIRSHGKPKTTTDRGALLSALSERDFQRSVVDGLKTRGYMVWVIPDMRKTTRGWPDVVAIHATNPDRLIAWELKSQTGRVRPEQKVVIALLSRVPGVDARIVRPEDWDLLSLEV